MKTMRILLLIVSFLTVSYGFAQGRKGGNQNKTPQEVASTRADRWQKELNLTADQRTQIQQALEKKIAAMRSNDKETAKQARAEFRTSLQNILTPEQQTQLKAKLVERKANKQKKKSRGKKATEPTSSEQDEDEIAD